MEDSLIWEPEKTLPELNLFFANLQKIPKYKEAVETALKASKIVKEVSGFTARDIQHECDHLDGIIFLEKVTCKNGFATREMINKFDLKNN